MPLLSNAAVALTAEANLMPENYNKVDIHLTDDIRRQLRAMLKYIESASSGADDLYARYPLADKYSRNKAFGFNVSALVDACIRKLLHDLDAGIADAAVLQALVDAYDGGMSIERMTIALDETAIAETERIIVRLEALGIRVKPRSKRGTLNRKIPANIAIAYAYRYVMSRS